MARPAQDRPDEESPLLGNYREQARDEPSHRAEPLFTPQDTPEDSAARKKFQLYVFVLSLAVLVVVTFGAFFEYAPQVDILEGIICDKYYKNANIDLPYDPHNGTRHVIHDCSVDPVQSELALVNQLYSTFQQLPSLLLAVPYGILADKIGRKPVLVLCFLGLILDSVNLRLICWFPAMFPIRAIWFGALFQIIGGGGMVAAAMLLTTIADVFDAEQRAGVLAKVTAAILVSTVVASPISAALMTRSSWIPFLICMCLYVVGFLMVIFLWPETLPAKKLPLLLTASEGESEDELLRKSPKALSVYDRLGHMVVAFKDSTVFLFGNLNILLLLFCFLISTLDKSSMPFLIQYVRKRFGWSFGQTYFHVTNIRGNQASILLSLQSAVSGVVLLGIFPLFSRYLLKKRQYSIEAKDLLMTRISAVVLATAFILLGLSFNVAILIIAVIALGLSAGFAVSARSLITEMVLPTQVGQLYAAVAVVNSVGVLVAGPLLAGTFHWGLSLGGGWIGLPWLVIGGASVFTIGAVLLLRLDRGALVQPLASAPPTLDGGIAGPLSDSAPLSLHVDL